MINNFVVAVIAVAICIVLTQTSAFHYSYGGSTRSSRAAVKMASEVLRNENFAKLQAGE